MNVSTEKCREEACRMAVPPPQYLSSHTSFLAVFLVASIAFTVVISNAPSYATDAVDRIPALGQFDRKTITLMTLEGITGDIYQKLVAREIYSTKRKSPPGISGSRAVAMVLIHGSVANTWEAVEDCISMPKFLPHFAGCNQTLRSALSADQIPADIRFGQNNLHFVRVNENVISFPGLTFHIFVNIWIDKPWVLRWKRVRGDMNVDEGYWKIITLSPRYQILIFDSLSDPGRLIPDWAWKSLHEKDLPHTLKVMRTRIEDVLEKR